MRIALFTDNYRPLVGGIESSISGYEDALRKLGHRVYVVCPRYPGFPDGTTDVIRLRSIRSTTTLRGGGSVYRAHVLTPWTPAALQGLDVDIVHSQTPGAVGIVADMFARRRRIPLIYTFHTLASEQIVHCGAAGRLLARAAGRMLTVYQRVAHDETQRRLPRRTIDCREQVWRSLLSFANQADAVIAPSQHVASLLSDRGLETALHVQPSGVDTAFYQRRHQLPPDLASLWSGSAAPTLVCLGRLTPEKRPMAIITAVSRLPADLPCRILFVGDGSARMAAADLAQRLGVADKVVFVGTREGSAKAAILQHSDGLILASAGFETQGLAIIEAISAGLPVVYCDDRLRDGVSPETAILTDPSPIGLARGIEELVRNRARRQEMADAARVLSSQYDSLLLSSSLAAIYHDTIARYRPPSHSRSSVAGSAIDVGERPRIMSEAGLVGRTGVAQGV